MRRRRAIALAAAAAVTGVAVPLASGRSADTYPLRVQSSWSGVDAPCPAGTPASVDCHPHITPSVKVPGLGRVRPEYSYPVDVNPPGCREGYHVLGYPARLVVEGKGDILLSVAAAEGCLLGPPVDSVLNPTQAFVVTGGTGPYAGATGSGTVRRPSVGRSQAGSGYGVDLWEGTLTVPGHTFDLAPPVLSGATSRTARAPKKAKRARVRFAVKAADDVDGVLPVVCAPRSGSRFRVGKRTTVRCSATDRSANTARASFAVTVRRAR